MVFIDGEWGGVEALGLVAEPLAEASSRYGRLHGRFGAVDADELDVIELFVDEQLPSASRCCVGDPSVLAACRTCQTM
ncbi:hypothetical protein LG324_03620 [Phycicoccus jejuensis]|uniref:hypothetical protein n=1 Tax=Phycicoccus jejuensis TaxID=367299 RepID=UPI00384F0B97